MSCPKRRDGHATPRFHHSGWRCDCGVAARLRDSWPLKLTASTLKGNPTRPSHSPGNRITDYGSAYVEIVQSTSAGLKGLERSKSADTVAIHSGDLPPRDVRDVLKQTKIPRDEFLKALVVKLRNDAAMKYAPGHAR